MVEEDRGCPDILLQVAAIRSALDKVAQIVLEDHIESCLVDSVKSGKIDVYLSELKEALARLF